jgi:hypothetical protein
MKAAAIKTVGKATAERLSGQGAGWGRAAAAAMVTGAATAVLTYKLLRGNSD